MCGMLSKRLSLLVLWLKMMCHDLSQEGMDEPRNLVDGEVAIIICIGYQMGEVGEVPSTHPRGGNEDLDSRGREVLAI
jgi:hypothetical protein